jgi:chemotaxis protein MotB
METKKPAPIIIKRRKAAHAHHGGAWKVAYADFVTAMMALFIVLWLLSSDDKVKKAVGGYFLDPTGTGNLMGSTMAGAEEALAATADNMSELKQRIEQVMQKMPDFKEIQQHVQITVTADGLRVEMLETEKGMFFESGSPQPSPSGEHLLTRLAGELGSLPNTLAIEGHTDAKPYAGARNYSNWELSTDRANAARRLMQTTGLRADQVAQVRGFADQRLRTPADPLNPANRRVSLIVQYLERPAGQAPASASGKPAPASGAPAPPHG